MSNSTINSAESASILNLNLGEDEACKNICSEFSNDFYKKKRASVESILYNFIDSFVFVKCLPLLRRCDVRLDNGRFHLD